ncbi:hypothetical protein HDV57DRAFT_491289 [Trichoderma longibrachiatum]
MASAEDLKSVLDFLNITSTYILSHDMGAGIATALAVKHPDLVRRLVVTEYLLPDFGFEAARNPGAYWDVYANWQLAFFSVTDAAEFFISGKEKQMLEWYFYHGSYSGATSFSEDVVNRLRVQFRNRDSSELCLVLLKSELLLQRPVPFKAPLGSARCKYQRWQWEEKPV